MNQTKIKGGCQSGSKVVPHDSKSDLPLDVVSSAWLGHVRRAQKLDNYSAILKCIQTGNQAELKLKP